MRCLTAKATRMPRPRRTGAEPPICDLSDDEGRIRIAALKLAKSSGKCRAVRFHDCQEPLDKMVELDQVRDYLEQKTAADIMTTPILTVRQSDTVLTAIELILKHGFNAAPVVDERGQLVGVIAEKDLMQALRHTNAWNLPISEFMRRDVIHFDESEAAIHVYEFLSQATIRRVIIVRDGQPTGEDLCVMVCCEIYPHIISSLGLTGPQIGNAELGRLGQSGLGQI